MRNDHNWADVAARLTADVDDGCEMVPLDQLVKRAGVSAAILARWCAVGHPCGVRLDADKSGRRWMSTIFAVERLQAAAAQWRDGQVVTVLSPRRTKRAAELAAAYADMILRQPRRTDEELKAARLLVGKIRRKS